MNLLLVLFYMKLQNTLFDLGMKNQVANDDSFAGKIDYNNTIGIE